MIVIGVDAHKRTHTLVAVDEVGRKLGERTIRATPDGNMEAATWATRWPQVKFAIEDCRHVTRRLEADLLTTGYQVVRVTTQLMAGQRRAGRERGKSDPIDALAVARVALREPDLPVARLDGPSREAKLLADYRDDLVTQRTRVCSKMRWHLHELDPELQIPSRGLRRRCVQDQVEQHLAGMSGVVAQIARELLSRCRELTVRINQLEKQLKQLVQAMAPQLLDIAGCGVLGAATIIGETAGVDRFRSKAAFARFTGTAPIPVWSGNSSRVRLNRGGNRRMNCALHMIAVTQARGIGPGKDYIERLQTDGKTRTEAIRLLRRRISDVVYRTLKAIDTTNSTDQSCLAPDLTT
ncbi:IS110 family transposase [Nonomuraea mangrovi]|uniref:IS110 family transposase n=1 Tax=Nonomuraea mangrovi TaxID=2316207 RepID=A0ABW4TBD1_9ACTN